MSRKIEDIQKEYNEAALKLGAEAYAAFAISEELERVELKVANLKNRMMALTKEANKLREKQPEQLELPQEVPSEQQEG